jgi:hypothetical protein
MLNLWCSPICDVPQFVMFPSLWCSPICDAPQFVMLLNMWCSPICDAPQYVMFPNLCCSPICDVPQYVMFPNLWCSPICDAPQYVMLPNLWCSPICDAPQHVMLPNLWYSPICDAPQFISKDSLIMVHVGRNMLDFYYCYVAGRGVWQQQCILRGFYLYELHLSSCTLWFIYPRVPRRKRKVQFIVKPQKIVEFSHRLMNWINVIYQTVEKSLKLMSLRVMQHRQNLAIK